MKKIIIVLVALAAVAAAAVFAWVKSRGAEDEITFESFENMPPSEKGMKVDEIDVKFDGKSAPAPKRTPPAGKGK